MHQEIVENFVFRGFSFPVLLPIAVFKVNSRGTKFLDINMEELKDRVAFSLMTYPYAYNGGMLYFIRRYLDFSLREMALVLEVSEEELVRWEEKSQVAVRLGKEQRIAVFEELKQCFFKNKEKVIDEGVKERESWNEVNEELLEIGMLYYLK